MIYGGSPRIQAAHICGTLSSQTRPVLAWISLNFDAKSDFFEWCHQTMHSFDRLACQTIQVQGSGARDFVDLWLKDSPAALIYHHREGSFDLTFKIVASCILVANVISVSCFLFYLRTRIFEGSDGSLIEKRRLMGGLALVTLGQVKVWWRGVCEGVS